MSLDVPGRVAASRRRPPARLEGSAPGQFGALVASVTSFGVLVVALIVNHAQGDPLGRFASEYAQGGSGKWRGDPQVQNVFQWILGIACVAVVLAGVSAARWRAEVSDGRERAVALAPMAIALAVVGILIALGVPAVAFALGAGGAAVG